MATPQELAEARTVVSQVYIDEKIRDYIVSVVLATREPKAHGLNELADFIEYGASPRASISLNLAARAHAFLRHRGYVTPEDVKAIGVDVLRHRVILTYEAEAEEVTSETVIRSCSRTSRCRSERAAGTEGRPRRCSDESYCGSSARSRS